MSYFATSIGAAASLVPVSVDRLAEILEEQDPPLHFGYSDDRSRLGGFWDDHLVEFIFRGEVLQIRAHWGRPLAEDHTPELLEWLNTRNWQWIWPKLYVERDDDDGLAVAAEHSINYEHGASDEQLLLHVQCAIATSLAAFRELDHKFPQAVEAFRAEHPDWCDE
ncbi:MAG: YbjN domain-containing protein [Micrococcales bacterium]|nr:YbjN domain-containing protein [Micrococcales bacterium]MCL2666601.1 YbjN domain-containing protein [Micrococcales bacterium]